MLVVLVFIRCWGACLLLDDGLVREMADRPTLKLLRRRKVPVLGNVLVVHIRVRGNFRGPSDVNGRDRRHHFQFSFLLPFMLMYETLLLLVRPIALVDKYVWGLRRTSC